MTKTITTCIQTEQWELVALYLLLGMARALEALPPHAVETLLDLLGGAGDRG